MFSSCNFLYIYSAHVLSVSSVFGSISSRILQNSQLFSLQTPFASFCLLQEFQSHRWHKCMYIHTCGTSSAHPLSLISLSTFPTLPSVLSIYLFSFDLIYSSLILPLISSVASNLLLNPPTELVNSAIHFNSRISFLLASSSLLKFFYSFELAEFIMHRYFQNISSPSLQVCQIFC